VSAPGRQSWRSSLKAAQDFLRYDTSEVAAIQREQIRVALDELATVVMAEQVTEGET
jgi:hypothetical protein